MFLKTPENVQDFCPVEKFYTYALQKKMYQIYKRTNKSITFCNQALYNALYRRTLEKQTIMCIKKRPYNSYGRSSALHFKYLIFHLTAYIRQFPQLYICIYIYFFKQITPQVTILCKYIWIFCFFIEQNCN